MKRLSIIILSLIFICALAACAGESKKTDVLQSTAAAQTQNSGTANAPKTNAGQSGIIAKSDNTVSSEDNGAIIKELDKELDSLFASLDDLEDVDDSDLSLD